MAYKVVIKNIVNPACNIACDPGNRGIKTFVTDTFVAEHPELTWEYVFKNTSMVNGFNDEFMLVSDATTFGIEYLDGKDAGTYILSAKLKYRNSDRAVPAYRQANALVLQPGEEVTIEDVTYNEAVFYTKVKAAFEGELDVTITPDVVTV